MTTKGLKKFGLGILLLPVGFISLILIGETFGGDISGLGHLIQLILLVALMWVAWKWPKVGGSILVSLGTILGLLYLIYTDFPLPTIASVEAILFLPIIISGVFFVEANKK